MLIDIQNINITLNPLVHLVVITISRLLYVYQTQANASEFQEDLKEMYSGNYMHNNVILHKNDFIFTDTIYVMIH